MSNHRKAEELRDHAAIAVAKERTKIHDAFTKGRRGGFSMDHVRDVLLQKGYRTNDIAYVEQLLNQKTVEQKPSPISRSLIVVLGIVMLLSAGFAFYAVTKNAEKNKQLSLAQQVKAYEAEKLSSAQSTLEDLEHTKQEILLVGDQLQRLSDTTADLSIEDRNAVLAEHATSLQQVAKELEDQHTALQTIVTELGQLNQQR